MATMPREAQLELYLGGWVPVTGRQRQPITITRGRLDWAGDVSPARLSAEVGNADGSLNPDNVLSPYWGLLNRNTPLRFTYTLLRDTFDRTVVDDWGTTTPDGVTGHVAATLVWTLSGTAANFDVGSGVGTMTIASASTKRRAALQGAVHGPVDVTLDIPTFSAPASGNNNQGITLRGTAFANHVLVEIDVTSASVVRLAIRDTDDNTYLYGPTTVAGVVRTSPMRIRAQADGQTIRGKVWNPSGNNEPYDFQASARSTLMTKTGEVGLRAGTGTGNTNVTFSFGELTVRSGRFFGVARRIAARSDSTGRDKYVILEGADQLRRMERNKAAAATVIQKFVEGNATQPLAYWPLDDQGLSLTGRVAAGAGLPAILNFAATIGPTQNLVPGLAFGSGRVSPWLNPVAKIDHDSYVRCGLTTTYSGNWTFHCAIGFPGGRYSDAADSETLSIGTAASSWQMIFYSANQTIDVIRPITGATLASISTSLYDDATHHLAFSSTQAGADVNWVAYLDGVSIGSGTTAGLTSPDLLRVAYQQGGGNTDTARERSFGHVAVYSGSGVAVGDYYNAVHGYPGETAGRRIERLCAENGISLSYVGDLDDTAIMGSQYAVPLLALLKECADTDLGTLTESRMAPGLVYRTHASLYNQTEALTLDYSAGQLAGSFEPDHDDQSLSNNITVRRVDGGIYRAIQTTGPNNVNDSGDDPDGVGTYDTPISVNPNADTQLADIGGWILLLGTEPSARIPAITVEAAGRNITAAQDNALLSLDVDDLISVSNLTSQDRYTPLRQLARGFTETLSTTFSSTVEAVCAPAAPYDVVRLDDTARGKIDATDSALTTGYDDNDTSLSASFTKDRWTTTAAHFPIPITIAGEDMTLTNVTGTTSPQTLTVTRNPTTAKALPSGSAVRLTRRATVAL